MSYQRRKSDVGRNILVFICTVTIVAMCGGMFVTGVERELDRGVAQQIADMRQRCTIVAEDSWTITFKCPYVRSGKLERELVKVTKP